MTADFAEIIEGMVDLFKSDDDLRREVRQFQFGMPARYTIFPTLSVAWRGGSSEYGSGDTKIYIHDYFVTVVDQGSDPEKLERSVLAIVKMIEAAIDADKTLGGLTYDMQITPMIAERAVEGDKMLLGAMLTVRTWAE